MYSDLDCAIMLTIASKTMHYDGLWIFLNLPDGNSFFATQLRPVIVWFFCAKNIYQSQRCYDEPGLHERKTGIPPADVHGVAHDALNAGWLSLQHYRQLLCGKDQRGFHDGAVAGVSGPESDQCGFRGIRHRYQFRGGLLFRRRKTGQRRHRRYRGDSAQRRPRLSPDGGRTLAHAGFSPPVHRR